MTSCSLKRGGERRSCGTHSPLLVRLKMMTHSAWLLFLLLLCIVSTLWGYPFRPPLDLDVTPRTTVFSNGMIQIMFFIMIQIMFSILLRCAYILGLSACMYIVCIINNLCIEFTLLIPLSFYISTNLVKITGGKPCFALQVGVSISV